MKSLLPDLLLDAVEGNLFRMLNPAYTGSAYCSGASLTTFQIILAKQFQALRTGDRFFWQNEYSITTARAIANTTLAQIIKRDTDTTYVRWRVFLAPSPVNHPHVNAPSPVNTQGRRRQFNSDHWLVNKPRVC